MNAPAAIKVTDDEHTAQIIAQMTAAGIETPPDSIIVDGRVHRFVSMSGRKGATGWYLVHPDPIAPVWWFGDWRLGIKERHEGDPGRVLEPEEVAARRERLRDLLAKIRAEEKRFQAGAAIEARQRWDRCAPAPAGHAYLRSKRIEPCGVRIDGDSLLVPMRDITGKLWSLQEIASDGRKHNQEGGRRKGCFFQIGEIGETFCIGEGFSTCATVHIATGFAVASAGEAGNLEAVARALREKYQAATIVICGDDDWLTKINGKPRNVGKLAAQKAAEAVDGVLSLPWFGAARPPWATDFNDMEKLSGIDEVATRIKLDLVNHQEDQERKRNAEPPPATPEDFGLATDDEKPRPVIEIVGDHW
jgi:putative DNA primase/helicase